MHIKLSACVWSRLIVSILAIFCSKLRRAESVEWGGETGSFTFTAFEHPTPGQSHLSRDRLCFARE